MINATTLLLADIAFAVTAGFAYRFQSRSEPVRVKGPWRSLADELSRRRHGRGRLGRFGEPIARLAHRSLNRARSSASGTTGHTIS
jgi:hypothetical protein